MTSPNNNIFARRSLRVVDAESDVSVSCVHIILCNDAVQLLCWRGSHMFWNDAHFVLAHCKHLFDACIYLLHKVGLYT